MTVNEEEHNWCDGNMMEVRGALEGRKNMGSIRNVSLLSSVQNRRTFVRD